MRFGWNAILIGLGALPLTGSEPGRGDPEPSAALDRLAWLGGCLEMKAGELVVEEQRMAARAGTMLGMSRTTSSARGLVEYELTLIREQDGRLVYEAHPSGQPAAVFPAMATTEDSAVFANPQHDYPQTIGYRRAGADSVTAWIDGNSRGKPRRVEFRYRRVSCPDSR